MPPSRRSRVQKRLDFSSPIESSSKRKAVAPGSPEEDGLKNPPTLVRLRPGRSSGPPPSSPIGLKRTRSTSKSPFQSPGPAQKIQKVAAVTPETPEEDKKKEKQRYIPLYLYKNVDYQASDSSYGKNVTTEQLKAVSWIEQHYTIPNDFETSRRFGALSGSSYPERVLQAYTLNKLQSKREGFTPFICTHCAQEGHIRNECPLLL